MAMHNNGYGHSVILQEQPAAKPRISFVTSWNAKCGIAEYTRYLVDAIGNRAVCTIIADHGTDLPEPSSLLVRGRTLGLYSV